VDARGGEGRSACVGVGEIASNRAARFSANDRAARGLVISERSKIAVRSLAVTLRNRIVV